MPQLTVHNAQVSTATVEIRTLTIDGKQVTLAVFRQLPDEPLIAEDGTLRGVPWGRVNYHPDKVPGTDGWGHLPRPVPCTSEDSVYGEHIHVVWQKGAELRRAIVGLPASHRPNHTTPELWAALNNLPQLFIAV
jgi:hypothetical protein